VFGINYGSVAFIDAVTIIYAVSYNSHSAIAIILTNILNDCKMSVAMVASHFILILCYLQYDWIQFQMLTLLIIIRLHNLSNYITFPITIRLHNLSNYNIFNSLL
jgi:hypothetical protein